MDNISKALVIVSGVLISISLISITMFVYRLIVGYNISKNNLLNTDTVLNFNRFFTESSFDIDECGTSKVHINGWDVYNIIKKVEDMNNDFDSEHSIDIYGSISSSNYFLDSNSYDGYNHDNLKGKYTYQVEYNSDGYVSSVSFARA